jgi:crossover junction endodeoxyribonuclease RuvC
MGLVAGCDPGLTGALFFIDPRNPVTGEAIDLPVHQLVRGKKAKRELDIAGLAGILAAHRPAHVFIEQVSSMPGQGVSSVFAFGKGYGIVLGVLAAHGVPVTLVSPAVWKRALGVLRAKDASRARASQLLPQCAGQWPLKKDHGKAEACLLALYGLRMLNGTAERR